MKKRYRIEYKGKMFVNYGCYRKSEVKNVLFCSPIEGYNKTTYVLIKKRKNWCCNCQGFKKFKRCSHQIGAGYYLKVIK